MYTLLLVGVLTTEHVLSSCLYIHVLTTFSFSIVGGTTAAASPVQHPLWFRFNEGFSNAVRRPVRIQDLL